MKYSERLHLTSSNLSSRRKNPSSFPYHCPHTHTPLASPVGPNLVRLCRPPTSHQVRHPGSSPGTQPPLPCVCLPSACTTGVSPLLPPHHSRISLPETAAALTFLPSFKSHLCSPHCPHDQIYLPFSLAFKALCQAASSNFMGSHFASCSRPPSGSLQPLKDPERGLSASSLFFLWLPKGRPPHSLPPPPQPSRLCDSLQLSLPSVCVCASLPLRSQLYHKPLDRTVSASTPPRRACSQLKRAHMCGST